MVLVSNLIMVAIKIQIAWHSFFFFKYHSMPDRVLSGTCSRENFIFEILKCIYILKRFLSYITILKVCGSEPQHIESST